MIDPVLVQILDRLKDLEVARDLNTPQIIARIEKLEEAAKQSAVDKQQAERREMARLREENEALKVGQKA